MMRWLVCLFLFAQPTLAIGCINMKDNWTECLAQILKSEGGFANLKHDSGGITNMGVTKKTYENWVGREVTEQEMRDLKVEDVAAIYKER